MGKNTKKSILPLFPLIKASPYLFFNCPFTYSSVCSKAIFMYPSKQTKTPGMYKKKS